MANAANINVSIAVGLIAAFYRAGADRVKRQALLILR
jgi:hypothetical protein